ncbi:MAG: hypothetical protein NWF13_08910 [Candidatus Bathyarchaeota archaeon]|nr:hypothetical protein [Candidatus Bathyarchaeota archaeon]
MPQKSSWKTKGFPNEVGSIGEKIAKQWLEEEAYRVYLFRGIMRIFANLQKTKLRMSRRRKEEYKENDRQIIQKTENSLINVFGHKYEAMKQCIIEIGELYSRLRERGERRAIGFDYIAVTDSEVVFIEVKVNRSEVKKYQNVTSSIVKEHGFQAMVLRLNIAIEVGESI